MIRIDSYLVYRAIVALQRFCDKYKVRLELRDIVNFSIAWHTGNSFEWTPCGDGFRRINTCRPYEGKIRIAFVWKGTEIDENSKALTDELNQMIFESTQGKWQ